MFFVFLAKAPTVHVSPHVCRWLHNLENILKLNLIIHGRLHTFTSGGKLPALPAQHLNLASRSLDAVQIQSLYLFSGEPLPFSNSKDVPK